MSTTTRLVAENPQLWAQATTTSFLDGVADGTLADAAFDRWLEQDHRFVEALARAWGLLLQTAPRSDFRLITSGIAAFTDELDWFTGIAAARGLTIPAPAALPETAAYEQALRDLAARAYPDAITAMWAIEAAYLTAWQGVADRWAAEGTPDAAQRYVEHVMHWADDGFAAFVTELGQVVDRELPHGPTPTARAAFDAVARHEAAFWSMTTG